MHESTTYQMILEEGEAKGVLRGTKQLLRELAEEQFGPPDQFNSAVLESLNDPDRVGRIAKRVNQVGSWKELLETP